MKVMKIEVIEMQAESLHFHDWEFQLCLQYWLGVRMLEEGSECPVRQVTTDGFGDYQVSCGVMVTTFITMTP